MKKVKTFEEHLRANMNEANRFSKLFPEKPKDIMERPKDWKKPKHKNGCINFYDEAISVSGEDWKTVLKLVDDILNLMSGWKPRKIDQETDPSWVGDGALHRIAINWTGKFDLSPLTKWIKVPKNSKGDLYPRGKWRSYIKNVKNLAKKYKFDIDTSNMGKWVGSRPTGWSLNNPGHPDKWADKGR